MRVRMHAKAARQTRHKLALGAITVAASLLLAACGSDGEGNAETASAGSGDRKLIIFAMPFPCGLNDYAKLTCEGAKAAKLPGGYELKFKTGIDYTDAPAFNSLLETTLQLRPAGLVVFANGPAAQTPVLNRACDQGAKVIFYDGNGKGVKCEASWVTPPNHELGQKAAEWLIDHPPANGSKEVAIVSQQPGQFISNDQRVEGFKKTIESAGYKVVATVVTTNDLEETRGKVTNALTAHSKLGAIFSANGPMGNGTQQALKRNKRVVQLTTDGNLTDIPSVVDGTVAVNVAQAPYLGGMLAVESMVKVIEGQKVPKVQMSPSKAIDKTNAQEYLDERGLR